MVEGDLEMDAMLAKATLNYRKGINKGLYKNMSKMGTVRFAELSEVLNCSKQLGINKDVVSLFCWCTESRIQGARFDDFLSNMINLQVSLG